MSEKHTPSTTTMEPVLQETFSVCRRSHTVKLTNTDLSWTPTDQMCIAQGTKSVRLVDLLLVSRNDVSTHGERTTGLTVVYVAQQADLALRRAEVTFRGEENRCSAFYKELESAMSGIQSRPRRLLVFVSPVSGQKNGPKVYEKKVAPIFMEANIETDVIVTQRAQHAAETIRDYDLKSIDGIVLVSGAGLYHEVTNVLTHRQASEAGQNVEDCKFVPSELRIPIGLIANGTCNEMAKICMGTEDVQTAAYAIALGYERKENLLSVNSGEDHVAFSSSMIGYGIWSDLMETKPSDGRLRFALSLGNKLLCKPFPVMNLSVSYRTKPELEALLASNMRVYQGQNDGDPPISAAGVPPSPEAGDLGQKQRPEADGHYPILETPSKDMTVDTTSRPSIEVNGLSLTSDATSGWTTVNGNFIGLMGSCSGSMGSSDKPEVASALKDAADTSVIMANRPSSKCEFFTGLGKMASSKPADLLTTPLEKLPVFVCQEWQVTVPSPSEPHSEAGRRERTLIVDGQRYNLNVPSFYIRLFSGRVRLYCNLPEVTGRPSTLTCSTKSGWW